MTEFTDNINSKTTNELIDANKILENGIKEVGEEALMAVKKLKSKCDRHEEAFTSYISIIEEEKSQFYSRNSSKQDKLQKELQKLRILVKEKEREIQETEQEKRRKDHELKNWKTRASKAEKTVDDSVKKISEIKKASNYKRKNERQKESENRAKMAKKHEQQMKEADLRVRTCDFAVKKLQEEKTILEQQNDLLAVSSLGVTGIATPEVKSFGVILDGENIGCFVRNFGAKNDRKKYEMILEANQCCNHIEFFTKMIFLAAQWFDQVYQVRPLLFLTRPKSIFTNHSSTNIKYWYKKIQSHCANIYHLQSKSDDESMILTAWHQNGVVYSKDNFRDLISGLPDDTQDDKEKIKKIEYIIEKRTENRFGFTFVDYKNFNQPEFWCDTEKLTKFKGIKWIKEETEKVTESSNIHF